ncbi:MAG: DUF1905 domain-containing protein [Sphingopyxis sp.]|nr:DUF1905 domain-containing protein [Sphingopyxis sp.]
MTETYRVTTTLWLWTTDKAPASWHFLTISGQAADDIHATALMRRMEGGQKRGWGSIKVVATIGATRWSTSIFPAKDAKGWLLPVKAAVRKAEAIVVGDDVTVTVNL